ncbi:type II secretion system F family protein [Arthrobacter burdickii]|uniref:Type II secretion system F family protein n=1 Tax=Arthrobacter burdickii TaxID=3035920 RepID=A0ABT8K017_9MICC|nr:type II secretion system F family protein [Arthrobacter burdickii]MDN4610763.1 type II secretion system F family protein [Arthrobacter burdickii]
MMVSPVVLGFGILLCFVSLLLLFAVVLKPRAGAIPLSRRRPGVPQELSVFSRVSSSTVGAVDDALGKSGGLYGKDLLYDAGVKMRPADFTVFVLSMSLVAALLVGFLSHVVLGLLVAIIVPFLARLVLSLKRDKRRARFDAQLPDTIQTLIGGLRAGHSVMRAIDAVAADAEAPASEELGRIVNETRIGKDSHLAIEEAAIRMDSEDFRWIAQAIQIHREVGGDLAEVLEHVLETIRERSEIKGQVRALSAEGKMSAYILMAVPVAIAVLFGIINPPYMLVLVQNFLGILMICASAVMYAIGGFWLSRVIKIKF